MNKGLHYSLISIVTVLLFILSILFVKLHPDGIQSLVNGFNQEQNTTDSNSKLSNTQETPSVYLTPTPAKPSEKSLKIAAYFFVRMSEKQKTEFKEKGGNKHLSDSEYINVWALSMDNDPALLATNEAIMEQTISQESTPQGNYSESVYTQPNSTQQRFKANCYTTGSGSSTYTTCY